MSLVNVRCFFESSVNNYSKNYVINHCCHYMGKDYSCLFVCLSVTLENCYNSKFCLFNYKKTLLTNDKRSVYLTAVFVCVPSREKTYNIKKS